MRILLVEDNADHRELMSLALIGHDSTWEVEGVGSGEEALRRLAEGEAYDAVFLDYSLPERDGLEVLEEIRRGEAPPPVVMVTGRGDEQVAVEAMKGSAYDYVTKQEGYLLRLPVVARRAVDANRLALERKQAGELLKKSEERFRTSVETLLEGFAILSAVRDRDGKIIDFKYDYINEAGCKMNQKALEEHMGKTLLELLPTHKEIGLFDEYARVVETGQPLTKEFLIYEDVYGGGQRLRQAFNVQITRLEDGLVTTWQDLTDKKKGEELLRQSEERLRLLVENAKDVVIMADLEGSIIYYNGSPEYGITAEEVLGKNPFSIFDPVIAARLMNRLKLVIKDGEALTFENVIPLNGESYWFLNQMYPIRDEKGRMIAVGLIARNITERKRAEDREQLAHEVLNLLNRLETTTNTIREILLLFKKKMDFEAVGIRLREGDDFPYFETNGFSEDFVQAERHLCAYDKEGKIVRDGKGNPVLECMCGNILCGRTDATLPFFTAGGSFWTNSTTDLLASTTEEDRQSRTRNRCNGEGYESVALIPLRSGDEIIGLLQLNDRRRNQFTPEMIHFFEGVGASVGIALSRQQAEEAVRESLNRWQATFDGIKDSIFLLDKEGVIFQINKNAAELFGKTEKEIQGHHCWEIVHGTSEPIAGCPIVRMKQSKQRETMFLPVDDKWYEVTVDPLLNQDGNLLGAVHIISDITERKRVEEALRESEADLNRAQTVAHVGSWYWEVTEDVLKWSAETYRMFGVAEGTPVTSGDFMALVHPEDRDYIDRSWQAALAGAAYDTENRIVVKGEVKWVHQFADLEFDSKGNIKAIGTVQDITERKRAEKALKRKSEEQELLLDNIQTRIWYLKDAETYGAVNKAHAEFLGKNRDEVGNKKLYDVFIKEEAEVCIAGNKEVFAKKIQLHTEEWVTNAKGEKRLMAVTKSPKLDENGDVEYVVCSAEDITERKLAEEALREAEEKYRSLFENSIEGIGISKGNHIVLANKALLDIWGYETLEQFICLPLLDHIAQESKSMIRERIEKREKGEPVVPRYEFKIIRKDGEIRDVEISTAEVLIQNEKYVQSTFRDITEHKRAEEALQIERNKLEAVTRHIGAGLAIISKDYRTLWGNENLKRIFGDIEGKICYSTYNQRTEICPGCGVREVYEKGSDCVVHEQVGKDIEGNTIWSEIITTPIKGSEGNITAALELVIPITERKRAEEALRETEELYRTVLQASPDGIAINDTEGRITFVSERMLSLYGLIQPEDVIGHSPFEFIAPEDHARAKLNMQNVFKNNYTSYNQYTLVKKDGTKFTGEINSSLLRDASGKPRGMISVIRDITERKRAEEQLRMSTEQLRSLSARLQAIREEERAQVAREIHDELGQALTGLKMDLSWLRKKLPKEKELIKKTQSMLKLVNSTIQTVRKISTELRPGILDDLGLIAAIEWQAKEYEDRTGIKCEFDSSLEEIELDKDCSTAVFRILQETLTNVVRHAKATKVEIRVEESESNLILRIKDNGWGIRERDLLNPKSLGLLGMRERAHIFGGEMEITGKHGKGTAVTVKIPLKTMEERRETKDEK